MYEKLDEVIMEACKGLIERNKPIYQPLGLEAETVGSNLVRRTQRLYKAQFGTEPCKMTIWRHIHKLVKEGKLILEMRPPVLLKVAYIRIAQQ